MDPLENAAAVEPGSIFHDPLRQALGELLKKLLEYRFTMHNEMLKAEHIPKDDENTRQRFVSVSRRRHAQAALGQFILFLNDPQIVKFCPQIETDALNLPLQDLLHALQELEDGFLPEMLQPTPRGKTRHSTTAAHFKAIVATAVSLRIKAGVTLEQACKTTASSLAKQGLRHTWGKKAGVEHPIEPDTVRDWRKNILRTHSGLLRDSYERHLRTSLAACHGPDALRARADEIVTTLALYAPGVPFRRLRPR